MKNQTQLLRVGAVLSIVTSVATAFAADPAATTNSSATAASRNAGPIRTAPTGHVSNYDEAKVGRYTLPDPLVLRGGEPVTNAVAWTQRRRPEILEAYESEIFGRVPARAPKARFEVVEAGTNVQSSGVIRKLLVGHLGEAPNELAVPVQLYLPATARGPVPLLMHLSFSGEAGPVAEFLAHGYGYAMFRYQDIQPDATNSFQSGVIGLAMKAAGLTNRAPDDWGAISAWAWGASRLLDYFESDRTVDARRVALIGYSRLGKTALWAGARDPRFALVFASCSGEMGAALSRRDYGETVDDMAANFPWWFAENFQKYSGHWTNMPVDAHELIALNAPHPVFITGGSQDQWADPKGEFLAEVAAGPVYRLLGKTDLGTAELPALDTPVISGDLGFYFHTGGHLISPADWKVFLEFADAHLKPAR